MSAVREYCLAMSERCPPSLPGDPGTSFLFVYIYLWPVSVFPKLLTLLYPLQDFGLTVMHVLIIPVLRMEMVKLRLNRMQYLGVYVVFSVVTGIMYVIFKTLLSRVVKNIPLSSTDFT